ncbi:tetratricopeptide repeat protein [Stella sp.]|uniref:tetratricopeptide repeat protein n=1 Tax=Stella sp. TaxID=2912054 RepID=UPI0035AFDD57
MIAPAGGRARRSVAPTVAIAFVGMVVLAETAGPSAARADIAPCDRLAGLPQPWLGHGETPPPRAGPSFARIEAEPAVTACRRAVDERPDHVRARFQLGRALDKAQRWDEAVQHYRRAAEESYAPAQASLGLLYEDGRGVPEDPVTAMRWYRLAAIQSYPPADTAIGLLHLEGRGTRRDEREAARWFRQSAERGDPVGQLMLGRLFQQGRGVVLDEVAAADWIGRAARQGDAEAETAFAFLLQEGRGVRADPAEAARWFRRAALQGDVAAQSQLGWIHEQGLGVAVDEAEAARWYQQAARRGAADAQRNLAWLYQQGRGVAQDLGQAARWYEAAAAQGDARAQVALAWLYEQGMGVPVDEAAAERLYRASARQGFWQGQNGLAWFLAIRGRDLPEALRQARAAAAQQPGSGDALDTLGYALFRSGRLAEAQATLERAAGMEAVEPARIREHLGDVYAAQGRRDDARREWEKAVAARPAATQLLRLQEKLRTR